MIGLIFPKELILIKQMHQKSVIFVIIGTLETKKLKMNHIFAIVLMNCNDVILNKTKDYYKIDKERLRVNARDKYRNLSEEEKNKEELVWKK